MQHGSYLLLATGWQGEHNTKLSLWEVCAKVRNKLPVRQVSDTRYSVYHLIILSLETSYGGVDVLLPSRQIYIPCRIGTTADDVLTLPLSDHTCAAMLLTYMWM